MKTLSETMRDMLARKGALGHFNISDSTQLNAIARAAQELDVPVAVGVSEGEGAFLGIRKMVAMAHAAREEYGIALYTNADHVHSVAGCKEAIDAGCDSVIFDGSKLPREENIAGMKEVVAYAQASGREVVTEGEVGYIGSSSKMLDEVPDDISDALPTPEDVQTFVVQTGARAVAPAVGNLHGMLKGRSNPSLRIELIRAMRIEIGDDIGMVLHGGSGIADDDFVAAIEAGINVVHINTEIRIAYRTGITEGLAANQNEIAPYRYLDHGRDAVYRTVKQRLQLFNNRS